MADSLTNTTPRESGGRGEGEEECQICRVWQPKLLSLDPCGHHLCAGCVGMLRQYSEAQRCPFCRQEFVILYQPECLVSLLCKQLDWRLPKAEGLRRLPMNIRAELLSKLKNRRLLYGDTLAALTDGLQLETLRLMDATNMTSADLQRIVPALAQAPKKVLLSNCPMLDDHGLSVILRASASSIEHINAGNASDTLQGCSLQEFAKSMPCLKWLEIPNCRGFESAALGDVAIGCASTLEYLDISGCRRIGNDAVSSLVNCRQLQHLNLCGLLKLETAPLISVLEACQRLRILKVTHCGRLNGSLLFQGVAAHCTELRELISARLAEVDDDAVISLALSDAGASLESWCIAGGDISNASLKVIRKNCPVLSRLDISDCSDITEGCLMDTIVEMRQLRVCKFQYCRHISGSFQLFVAQLLASRSFGLDEGPVTKSRTGLGASSPASSASKSTSASSSALGGESSSSSSGASIHAMPDSGVPSTPSIPGSSPFLDLLNESTEYADMPGISALDSSLNSVAPGQPRDIAHSVSEVHEDSETGPNTVLQTLVHEGSSGTAGSGPICNSSEKDAWVELPTSGLRDVSPPSSPGVSMNASSPQSPSQASASGVSPRLTPQAPNSPLALTNSNRSLRRTSVGAPSSSGAQSSGASVSSSQAHRIAANRSQSKPELVRSPTSISSSSRRSALASAGATVGGQSPKAAAQNNSGTAANKNRR